MSASSRTYYTIIFIFLASIVWGQSLEDYLLEATANNSNLKFKKALYESSLQQIEQSGILLDPTLSVGAFVVPIETRNGAQTAKISINQQLPWFGTLSAQKEMALQNSKVAYQDYIQAKLALLFEIQKAYFSLQEINQHITVQIENIEILKSLEKLTQQKFENNKGTMVDVLRVKIAIDNNEIALRNYYEKQKSLSANFNALLSRSNQVVYTTGMDTLPSFNPDYRNDSLLINNPGLLSIDFNIDRLESYQTIVQNLARPRVGVGLDYMFISSSSGLSSNDAGRDAIMPMVSLSLPIHQRKYNAAMQETNLKIEALTYSKSNIEFNLYSSLENARNTLELSKNLFNTHFRSIQTSSQILDLLQVSYRDSGKDFEELLRAQSDILAYKILLYTDIKSYQIQVATIDYLTTKYN